MSVIAGIDFSTKAIDIVLLDEDTDDKVWQRCYIGRDAATGDTLGDAFERTRRVRSAMPSSSWWEDNGVIAIGIEQPRGNFGVTPLFRIQGAVLACLPTRLLVQPWNPSSWRKAVGLAGNAPKLDVANWACLQLGASAAWPQDACDALCIARATRSVLVEGVA